MSLQGKASTHTREEEEDGWSSSERDWVTGRQSVLGQPASPSSEQAPQHSASPARQPKPQVAQAHGIIVEKAKLWQVVEEDEKEDLYSGEEEDLSLCRHLGATSSYPRLRLKQADGQNKSSPTQKYLKIVGEKSRKNQLLYSLRQNQDIAHVNQVKKLGSGMTLSD